MPIEPWWETNPATTPRQELGMVSPELPRWRDQPHCSGSLPRKVLRRLRASTRPTGGAGSAALVNERVAVLPNLVDSGPDLVGDGPAAPYAGQSVDQIGRPDTSLGVARQVSVVREKRRLELCPEADQVCCLKILAGRDKVAGRRAVRCSDQSLKDCEPQPRDGGRYDAMFPLHEFESVDPLEAVMRHGRRSRSRPG